MTMLVGAYSDGSTYLERLRVMQLSLFVKYLWHHVVHTGYSICFRDSAIYSRYGVVLGIYISQEAEFYMSHAPMHAVHEERRHSKIKSQGPESGPC